ncbi:CBS domain-containing protein [Baaleninema simplex]|uniref:CBS domain-containing protein n=1 Tax=Baaleninema simplex TaxID=2862350 RepID=UPI000349E52D|nr:CBS domain-containing protein [Baaleninema simplex]
MDLILCHTTADFDSLGAAVGLARLRPGSRIVLTGGCHPGVEEFVRLHRDEYPLIERRSVNPDRIRSITVVDTQYRDRLGKAADWFDAPHLQEIALYDHHPVTNSDIPATVREIEPLGAVTTLVAEKLQEREVSLTVHEATVMALGIHVDSGSLTYDHSTPRDALALAWLMKQGASVPVIAEYIEPGLSDPLQNLLSEALDTVETETVWGYDIASVILQTPHYVPGLAGLASRLLELTDTDAIVLVHEYATHGDEPRIAVIGRSRVPETDLNRIFQQIGGGGHAKAASAQLRNADPKEVVKTLREALDRQIPPPPTARDIMSSPVRTIRPQTTIGEAHRILLRYGHSGLSVVNEDDTLVGVISRRDLDIALHHGFNHAPVKGYMTTHLKTIEPNTLLPDIESLMVTYDIGRLPVLENGELVGIVTRTDVLRELHQDSTKLCPLHASERRGFEIGGKDNGRFLLQRESDLLEIVRSSVSEPLWTLLSQAAEAAEERGWHLYLVGGAVRDLLLAIQTANSGDIPPDELQVDLTDIDLVVDGFHRSATVGAGVELAKVLQNSHSAARLDVHGQFQTAALLWHKDPVFDSLWVDIATARTEFYPYPAANPEVEASSIRQDLYRRDFTINALALRLTRPHRGKLFDFFGGLLDLQDGLVRVLHPNSFIEDPTRIYRAVRFAVRLGFDIEEQTEGYIRHALDCGVYDRSRLHENSPKVPSDRLPALQTRLKNELKYLLQAPYWKPALRKIDELRALQCIYPGLALTRQMWWQVRLVDRWLHRFRDIGDRKPVPSPPHWQILLEVILSHVRPDRRGTVARHLQLPEDSIQRLEKLASVREDILRRLSVARQPSDVVRALRQYDWPSAMLVALSSPREVRRQIWRYLVEWSQVKPILNGRDLKRLGYKPGPQFKAMLDDLLAATLDDTFARDGASREEQKARAEVFLAREYPLVRDSGTKEA